MIYFLMYSISVGLYGFLFLYEIFMHQFFTCCGGIECLEGSVYFAVYYNYSCYGQTKR